jgi:hypothetical protein
MDGRRRRLTTHQAIRDSSLRIVPGGSRVSCSAGRDMSQGADDSPVELALLCEVGVVHLVSLVLGRRTGRRMVGGLQGGHALRVRWSGAGVQVCPRH